MQYFKTLLGAVILAFSPAQHVLANDLVAPLDKAFEICIKDLPSLDESKDVRLSKTIKENGLETLIVLGVRKGRKLCQFGIQNMSNSQSLEIFPNLLETKFGSDLNTENPKLDGVIAEWSTKFDGKKYQFAVLDYQSITLSFAASMMIIYRDIENQ